MRYRINYGNGQVHEIQGAYSTARKELESLRGDAWSSEFRIERYDGTEWVGLGKSGRLRTAEREGL